MIVNDCMLRGGHDHVIRKKKPQACCAARSKSRHTMNRIVRMSVWSGLPVVLQGDIGAGDGGAVAA